MRAAFGCLRHRGSACVLAVLPFHWSHAAAPRTVEVGTESGTETLEVRARETEGDERARIWEAQKASMPVFREYKAVAGRDIPVLLLERV